MLGGSAKKKSTGFNGAVASENAIMGLFGKAKAGRLGSSKGANALAPQAVDDVLMGPSWDPA